MYNLLLQSDSKKNEDPLMSVSVLSKGVGYDNFLKEMKLNPLPKYLEVKPTLNITTGYLSYLISGQDNSSKNPLISEYINYEGLLYSNDSILYKQGIFKNETKRITRDVSVVIGTPDILIREIPKIIEISRRLGGPNATDLEKSLEVLEKLNRKK